MSTSSLVDDLKPARVPGHIIGPFFLNKWPKNFSSTVPSDLGVVVEDACLKCSQDLRDILEEALGTDSALRPFTDFDDTDYYLPPIDIVQEVFDCRTSLRLQLIYWAQILDCEDFAYSLKGDFALARFKAATQSTLIPFATGVIWGTSNGSRHVANVAVVCDDGKPSVMVIDTTPGYADIYPIADWGGPVDYLVI